MFMDLSSEMIHALLPLYLVGVLGTSTLTVGFIEGIAEATALITRIFSGALSDWLGRRKLLAAIGYGLAALTKPVFPLANSVGWVVTARFVDRIGKGIRGAPCDALVADLSPEHLRGASFGLRQSLDTTGAFLGPLAAMALILLTANSYTTVFWVAVIPAFIAFGLLLIGVEEPNRHVDVDQKSRLRLGDLRRFEKPFWMVVVVSTVLALARFSEAFLILRAQSVGLPVALAPVIMIVMNVVYALASYPAGAFSDRLGRYSVLAAGIAALAVADVVLAFGGSAPLMLLGVVFWGLHMALTQGLLAALVADTAPSDLRGTAFGLFNLASGVAMLAGSVTAGALWDAFGPAMTFLFGGAVTAVALHSFLLIRRRPV
jgi:MFS family permease